MANQSLALNGALTQTEKQYLLTPLAMVIPNEGGVYSYSQYREPKTVTESRFAHYAPKKIRLGTPDNWQIVTAWACGLDAWYLAVEIQS